MLRLSSTTEFSIGTCHRVLCARCAPHVIYRIVVLWLSGFCFPSFVSLPTCDGSTLLIRVYRIKYQRLHWAQYVEFSFGIALLRAREWYHRLLSRGPRPGQDRTLVILLLIYSVTRRRCSSLHDDSVGTTVHGVSNWYGTLSPL